MRVTHWICLACVCGGVIVRADEGVRPSTTQPAQVSADDKVMSDLVKELGDDNPKVRSQAAAILRRHGKDALTALQAGSNDSDLQVRASSKALIDQITNPARYRTPEPSPADVAMEQRRKLRILQMAPPGRIQAQMGMLQIVHNAVREVTATEAGREVRIHEDPNSISVVVTTNGKVDRYDAKTLDELKTNSPEGFKVYQRYLGPR